MHPEYAKVRPRADLTFVFNFLDVDTRKRVCLFNMEDYNSADEIGSHHGSDDLRECHQDTKALRRWRRYTARLELHCQQHRQLQVIYQAQIAELEKEVTAIKVCFIIILDSLF